MAGSMKAAAQGGDEPGVLIGDHQLHTAETACFQRAQEATPERLLVAVADVAAEDLPVAVGRDPRGHDDGHHLRGAWRTCR
jgi:hypothetical protein